MATLFESWMDDQEKLKQSAPDRAHEKTREVMRRMLPSEEATAAPAVAEAPVAPEVKQPAFQQYMAQTGADEPVQVRDQIAEILPATGFSNLSGGAYSQPEEDTYYDQEDGGYDREAAADELFWKMRQQFPNIPEHVIEERIRAMMEEEEVVELPAIDIETIELENRRRR